MAALARERGKRDLQQQGLNEEELSPTGAVTISADQSSTSPATTPSVTSPVATSPPSPTPAKPTPDIFEGVPAGESRNFTTPIEKKTITYGRTDEGDRYIDAKEEGPSGRPVRFKIKDGRVEKSPSDAADTLYQWALKMIEDHRKLLDLENQAKPPL